MSSPAGGPASSPLTAGVDHVGLSVRNLEQTFRFFAETLGFRKVGERPDYPAIFVSDGSIMITLWQVSDPEHARSFDRRQNVGLHHLALRVGSVAELQRIRERLAETPGVQIECPPQALSSGVGAQMMCIEPGGIRIEFISRSS